MIAVQDTHTSTKHVRREESENERFVVGDKDLLNNLPPVSRK
jgi:hypothetical protein